VGKNKLKKFKELGELDRVFQPDFHQMLKNDFHLKGKWNKEVFNNNNPLVLELGCGKGEYTLGLAQNFPEKNFIGVDIKGARMWKGAKESNEKNLLNSGFLRTRIELIRSFFGKDEISEIWLTFPDPQLKESRKNKRLSSSKFLGLYQNFIVNQGLMHLKTDSAELYQYTLSLAKHNQFEILLSTDDLYASGFADDILGIKTFYEKQFLEKGMKIHYLKFRLPNNVKITELSEDE
jgi:tRNA (guanine-N7-)-methyltransferase